VAIEVLPGSVAGEPFLNRNPAILYGLGNLVENAVDFATSHVVFSAEWNATTITVTIRDDGGGFSKDLLEKVGEPFITTRKSELPETGGGLGLGLFIAKTLLQRSGAAVEFANSDLPAVQGAIVKVSWPRKLLDISGDPAQPSQLVKAQASVMD
jgi:two-component system sensor histidine kinase RegB